MRLKTELTVRSSSVADVPFAIRGGPDFTRINENTARWTCSFFQGMFTLDTSQPAFRTTLRIATK